MSPYSPEAPGPERHRRFVTLCQQMLALAVVVAVLTPAARTVTMDVRPAEPANVVPAEVSLRSAAFASAVPARPVAAEVEEYALTAPAGRLRARVDLKARTKAARGGGRTITSKALPVDGYGTVGVTWSKGSSISDDDINVRVRTRQQGRWSGWTKAEYHDEHGPDPKTREGKRARPGTDALLVGDVDAVQVKVATKKAAPADMRLAVIDPGKQAVTARQKPAIDTGRLATRASATTVAATTDPATEPTDEDEVTAPTDGEVALAAGEYTPRPMIYSRAQWGANEKLRDKRSLSHYEVHGGFIHHTVNANKYSAADVPGIIRGIYSYHTRSRGWSDIGYNFLVDKFGRIWEGRAGGVDRPVVGAHTQNYNQYSFAMSAIGNFETARPKPAMINAYGVLFAWKLSLHGVYAGDTSVQMGRRSFPAISGHRDAGSTACPGKHLYAQIPAIRNIAAAGQRSFEGRVVRHNYVSSTGNDILMRRTSDGHLIAASIGFKNGAWKITRRVNTGVVLAGNVTDLYKAGDWDRDGYNDVISRRSDGLLYLHRGRGSGKFHAPQLMAKRLRTAKLIAAPGDVTGDGYPDLMGQPKGKGMQIFAGKGGRTLGVKKNSVRKGYAAYGAVKGRQNLVAGLYDADGAPDSIVRKGKTIKLYRGNGPGGWFGATTLESSSRGFDWLMGMGRVDSNRTPDFVGRSKATGTLYLLPGTASGWGRAIALGTFKEYDIAG
jgi:uncharacterized protein with LGFP repeats